MAFFSTKAYTGLCSSGDAKLLLNWQQQSFYIVLTKGYGVGMDWGYGWNEGWSWNSYELYMKEQWGKSMGFICFF